jgi:parallel beta-helix repeat protein
LLAFLAAFPAAHADECEYAFDLMQITKDTVLCNKAFDVPSGITIATDGVTLDCNGAIIRGTGMQDGQGVFIDGADGVTVKNCNILNYDAGIYVKEGNRNVIEQNALLKNKVGVRMLQAFENQFITNADKSIIKPVSALASKFNSFWITNKDLDQSFCEVNLCNSAGPMSPCANDDFYCSPSCSFGNDNDCRSPEAEAEPDPFLEKMKAQTLATGKATTEPAATENKSAAKKPEVEIPSAQAPKSFMSLLPAKARFWTMAFLFILSYLFGFLIFQHHHWVHK